MATRTVIELIDDLDGSEATETVRFALDGTEYEIDLAEQNAEELRDLLTRFVYAGRKAARSSNKLTAAVRRLSPAADTKAVRAWAAENGIEINARGRIKDDVVERYLASMS
ncbi:Lsr2 family protein [Arthrobacter sp. NPDC093125]|uniref:histone-like nucleoid-structuring protein Lsr2 n=1 Tax=Arthrobacter sp. NPDC093125 TaxID=3363944 RepID=UPI003824F898